jgi:hypothetical protein
MADERTERASAGTAATLGAIALGLVLLLLGYGFITRLADSGPADALDPATAALEESGDIVQVGVRNGTTVAGLARRTRDVLRRQGFDVLEADNFERSDVDSSFVIDRVGNPDMARRVADALGVAPSRILEDIRPDLYLDATVVIGADYQTLTGLANESATR